MTKCVTLDGVVINVGPWDYQMTVVETADGMEGSLSHELIGNPLPDGAIDEDLALAWTSDGSIVRGDDPSASVPYS